MFTNWSNQIEFVLITQKQIALQFATESGMILRVGILNKKLRRQQTDPSNPFMEQLQDNVEVMKFDCERLSCFAEEKEVLFFGGDTVLRIKGIIHHDQGKWMKYDKYLEAINVFSRMMDGFSVKNQPIVNRKRDQKMMKHIVKDVLHSLLLRLSETKTPKYVHELVLFHHSAASHIRLIYDELLTEYKWLDSILKNNAAVDVSTLDIANIALLFCHSEKITFLMSDDYDLNDVECFNLMEKLVLMAEMGLEMTVHLKWSTDLPEATVSNLRRYGLGVNYRFDKHSVTFTVENAQFGLEAQQRFTSRIESMIEALSRTAVVVQDAANAPDPEMDAPIAVEKTQSVNDTLQSSCLPRRINMDYVAQQILLFVAGYCRAINACVNSLFPKTIPSDVQHLVLLFCFDEKRAGKDQELKRRMDEYTSEMQTMKAAIERAEGHLQSLDRQQFAELR